MRRALTNRGAHAVHRRIAAAQHHHAFALHIDPGLIRQLIETHNLTRIGDQERQRVMDARRIFIFKAAAHGLIGADAQEDRVKLINQIAELDIAADFGIQLELNAHLGEHRASTRHYLFFQLERRNAEGKQPADFRVAIVNHRFDAVAGQHVGAGEASRACTDNRHAFTGRLDVRQVGTPAHFHRFIVDIALDIADGHRAKLIVQRTGAFAQAILRTNATAHFRQAVGLMRKLGRLDNATFIRQLQPVGNVVVYRALPFAVGVAA